MRPVSALHVITYHAFLSLSEKAMRDEELFKSKDQSDQVMDRFREIYHELKNWPDDRPDCIKLGPRSTPHILALQYVYLLAIGPPNVLNIFVT